jgi:DNA invertase Pin-like site-specific DNA recombinase
LNLGGGNVDTGAPMGSMVFTVMAALARWNSRSNADASTNPTPNPAMLARTLADDARSSLTVRSPTPADSSNKGQPASHVARDLGMSCATLYRRIANLDAEQGITAHPGSIPH